MWFALCWKSKEALPKNILSLSFHVSISLLFISIKFPQIMIERWLIFKVCLARLEYYIFMEVKQKSWSIIFLSWQNKMPNHLKNLRNECLLDMIQTQTFSVCARKKELFSWRFRFIFLRNRKHISNVYISVPVYEIVEESHSRKTIIFIFHLALNRALYAFEVLPHFSIKSFLQWDWLKFLQADNLKKSASFNAHPASNP